MIVTIPSRQQHEGIYSMTIEISDLCPVCGGPRGVPKPGLSYDESRRLHVSVWTNPCGHTDLYSRVREEYAQANKNKPNKYYCDECEKPVEVRLLETEHENGPYETKHCSECGAELKHYNEIEPDQEAGQK